MTSESRWLTVETAAAKLGLTPTYVAHLLRSGQMAGERRGGAWLADAGATRVRASDRAFWISYVAAAELVGCSAVTIGKAVRDGRLEHRPGRGRGVASISRASAEKFADEWQAVQEAARERRAARAAGAPGPPQDGSVWLDTETTALVLSISPSRVRQLAKRESLPFTKRGGRRWFRRDHVEVIAAARAALRTNGASET